MTDDQPVVNGELNGGLCPRCKGPLLHTEHGTVCWNWNCEHVEIRLQCDTCGANDRRQPGADRPCWVRILVLGGEAEVGGLGKTGMITACSAACVVLAVDQLAIVGRVAVGPSPEPPGSEPPGPAL